MTYRNKKLLRNIQKYVGYISEQLHFKVSHISPAGKITLLGGVLGVFSLFQSWIYAEESIIQGVTPITHISSFSSLLGYVGVIMLLLHILIAFCVLSLKKKEKLFFFGGIRIQEVTITFYGGCILFILSLQSFLFISGLQTFSANILYGKGIIFSFIGSIFILIGSYLYKKEYRKNSKGTYMSEMRGSDNIGITETERKNMKLPF